MIFETHAHYDDEAYDNDREELLASMKKNGIGHIINVCATFDSVEKSIALTQKYDLMYSAIGIHPDDIEQFDDDKLGWLEERAKDEKCVAVGEIGLDYHYPEPGRELQKEWFEKQLFMAKRLDKPVIIHSRDAAEDTMKILLSKPMEGIRGVMHCYSYSVETAKELMKRDFMFGIGGVVTFKNARKLVEAVEYLPMDRLLLETDSPYLAPTPHRGERNSSLYIPLIAEKIAEIKGITAKEVIAVTEENASKLFGVAL
ncbi:MAG: TatD family hydrolase [Lachnospiraceae bacterium]|nr:TatD family hydrolase [Lachnospiraceae bacterium]